MAEQVARCIENGLRNHQGKPPISASIGIGVYRKMAGGAAELIEAADQQIYKYKRTENRWILPALARIPNSKRAGR